MFKILVLLVPLACAMGIPADIQNNPPPFEFQDSSLANQEEDRIVITGIVGILTAGIGYCYLTAKGDFQKELDKCEEGDDEFSTFDRAECIAETIVKYVHTSYIPLCSVVLVRGHIHNHKFECELGI